MHSTKTLRKQTHQQLAGFQVALIAAVCTWAVDAHAYLGEKAIKWAVANITMPLGVACIIIALVSAKFNPKAAASAGFVALICIVIAFVASQGQQVIQVMQP